MQKFRLLLKNIPQGEFTETYSLDDSFFSSYHGFDLLGGDLKVTLKGRRVADIFELNFSLKGNIKTICSRCDTPLIFPMEGEFRLIVKLGDEVNTDFDEEVIVLRLSPILELDRYFYEYIVLSLPISRVHEEGGCSADIEDFFSRQFSSKKEYKSLNNPFISLLDGSKTEKNKNASPIKKNKKK